jgi:hypothetical protein
VPRVPLPITFRARTEFGFARTECSCPACVTYCRYMPGYLIPADLDRLRDALGGGRPLMDWAEKHLRASPGAVVRTGSRLHRIRTLVPARGPSGSCKFFHGGTPLRHPPGCPVRLRVPGPTPAGRRGLAAESPWPPGGGRRLGPGRSVRQGVVRSRRDGTQGHPAGDLPCPYAQCQDCR